MAHVIRVRREVQNLAPTTVVPNAPLLLLASVQAASTEKP